MTPLTKREHREHKPTGHAEIHRDGGIYSVLRGMGFPKDIVPWRRSDFDARAARVRTERASISSPVPTRRSGVEDFVGAWNRVRNLDRFDPAHAPAGGPGLTITAAVP